MTLLLVVYLSGVVVLFVPVVRWVTRVSPACGRIDHGEDIAGVASLSLLMLSVWPIWVIGVGPVYGFGQLIKYVGNYKRETKGEKQA